MALPDYAKVWDVFVNKKKKRRIAGVLHHNIRKCGKILDMRKEDLDSIPSSAS